MTAGRPVKYKTANEMQRIIDLYFLACKVRQTGDTDLFEGCTDDELAIITDIDDTYPSVTGLALTLDLTRQSLINYEGKPEFLDTIKKAKARVEAFIEQRLYLNNPTGCIFNLKNNFGWKDKTETDLTSSDGSMKPTQIILQGIRAESSKD